MSQYLGDISAYALAVSQGYTGTEEEYAELMASYATVGQTAVTAAQTATTKASEAATSATTATTKASEATTAATTATTKAGEASTSASTATSAKDTAVSASQTATTKASEATTAAATATSAKTDAVAANTAAQSAKTAAQTAQAGAETAAASVQSSAAQIATNTSDITELKEDLTDLAPKEDMLKSFPTDTASGSVASFADGANVPVKSLIVDINPVQSGSGDPSPTNVRPISGWSEVNVSHSGADMTNPTVISIQLGQTVYGGTLDVTKGELVIDHKGVDMGSMDWELQGGEETQFQRFYSVGISTDVSRDNMDSGTMLDLISPIAKAGRNPVYTRYEDNRMCVLSSTGGFYIVCTAYTTAAEFKTAVTGMMLVYKLATPLTISLTPHEVRSLLGANNIWADTGDSTVEYRADPTLYIQRLTEPDADMVADANIVSGQYFMVGNSLYKATANIASGATISPNVNCTRKSLSEALNELNA